MPNTINRDQVELLEAFKQYLFSEDTSRNTASGFREYLQEQIPPMAPATINRRLAALRRFFTWAKERQFIAAPPTQRIRNVESTLHGPRSLDRKRWNRLLRTVEQAKGVQGVRDRCIILFLYHTGLRAGELAIVQLSDLTFRERSGQVSVRRGKGNKARSVPLSAEARCAINDYMQVRPSTKEQALFIGQRGEPLSAHAIHDIVVK